MAYSDTGTRQGLCINVHIAKHQLQLFLSLTLWQRDNPSFAMSSSNPFRRDPLTNRAESSAASVAELFASPRNETNGDNNAAGFSPKEGVRNSSRSQPQSPSSLPDNPRPSLPVQTQPHNHDNTASCTLSSPSRKALSDAILRGGDEVQSTDTQRTAEPVDSSGPAPGMPPNPFIRTLATIEEPWQTSSSQEHVNEAIEPVHTERSMPRASMDVNAFKNLLMTGKTTAEVPGGLSQIKTPNTALADNGSSTDTSSVSRQSLSETAHEVAHETPRTSYEQSISEFGDENTQLLQGSQKHDRAKPIPPKHRHGKAVPPQGPQIVSFADFSPSFSPPSPSTVPIVVPCTSKTSPTRTDLDKPLPPPPRPSSRDSASIDKDVLSPRRPSETSEVSGTAPLRKIPPTVPLARRASRHGSLPVPRSRSNTQTSNASAKDETETRSISESINSNKAPPPPPKRRSNVITIPQNYTPDDDAGSLSLSRTSSLRSPPPVPVTRNRSLSQLSSPSTTSVSSSMVSPPPPPPPRRSVYRRSSQGSTEMSSPLGSRKVSQEAGRSSFDSDHRRGSMGSILREYSITEEAGIAEAGPLAQSQLHGRELSQVESQQTKNILADMEAFQREIDELQKKFEDGR
ncbi:hypothetical protein FKW77_001164 [Venturia effusa]|uniref:Uncharacterized protein n=1 Tax=Venturia effusa TaxID=50376 RepID=A0A517L6M1_9PEZI|nr:hypothetical protein FKW77_001164 [Venturia effusa]